ncbi:MAG: Holliday junction resolvase RuvX [Chitinophagales bacterium]|nr:Holliday junction resolvase RuvX [Chitinophagales bacterium]MDW8274258.1 Holliday junction resolvase RuvX [Chitinophagales bacterium]
MPRILALDYGKKRTGVAVSDPLKIIATGLDTIATTELKTFLKNYISGEEVEALVVGKPLTKKFDDNDLEHDIELFIKWFNGCFPAIKVHRIDERFTSKIASQTIATGGLSKKERQKKELVDKVSAVILLQNFLEMKRIWG